MKGSVILGATAVIVILGAGAGGGYFYLQKQAHNRLDQEIKLIEQTFPGSSVVYDHADTNVFSRSVILNQVKLKDKVGQLYTVDKLTFQVGSHPGLISVSADGFEMKFRGDSVMLGNMRIKHVDLNNFETNKDAFDIEDGQVKKIHLGKLKFDLLNVNGFGWFTPGKGKVTVNQFQVRDYGVNRMSDQMLKDFEIKASDNSNSLRLGMFQVNGYPFADILKALDERETIKLGIGYPKAIDISNIDFQSNEIHYQLHQFHSNNINTLQKDLVSKATFNGMMFDVKSNEFRNSLHGLGYDRVEASGNMTQHYDYDQKLLTLSPLEITLKDMFTIDFNVKSQIPSKIVFDGALIDDVLKNVSDGNQLAVDKYKHLNDEYKFISLQFKLRDGGLMDRMIGYGGKKTNQTNDQVKQQLISFLKQNGGDTKEAQQVVQAVSDVINNPDQELVIELKFDKPYSLNDLDQFSNVPEIMQHMEFKAYSEARKQ